MPFLLQANADDHVLPATFEFAKDAFAKAVEWHVLGRFTNINIDDGKKSYSIDEFSSMMALREIVNTVEADAAQQLKAKRRSDLICEIEELAPVRFGSILLQKSVATDLAIGPFVESRALKRWP